MEREKWIRNKYNSTSIRNPFKDTQRNIIQAGHQVQRQPIISSHLLIPLSLPNMDLINGQILFNLEINVIQAGHEYWTNIIQL